MHAINNHMLYSIPNKTSIQIRIPHVLISNYFHERILSKYWNRFFILNVGFLSEIEKNSIAVVLYVVVLTYDILALHFSTVNYIKDTLQTPKTSSLNNGKNYIIFAIAAIGGIIGMSIARAGLSFIIAPISIVAAFYLFRIVTTAFSTYVNLDMLCQLKAELEDDDQEMTVQEEEREE